MFNQVRFMLEILIEILIISEILIVLENFL